MGNHNYVSFPIEKIMHSTPLPGDLYLFVSGHFIKFKNAEDNLPVEKYDLFLMKGIQYVFVDAGDLSAYESWYQDIRDDEKDSILEAVGSENEELVDLHLGVKDELLRFITADVTDESIQKILTKTRDLVQKATVKRAIDTFMAKMLTYSDTLSDHSGNVGNLATYLAQNIGYSQQILLENIYIGGVLHDYGKVRIDKKYLEDPTSDAYKTAIRKHPDLGRTALLVDTSFPDEVLRIIGEHHERFDGKGYPKGLKRDKIYDLTKVVSIANIFDNVVMKTEGSIPERQNKALKFIEKEAGGMFDPKIVEKCIKAMGYIIAP